MAEIKTPRRYYLHKRLEARLYECSDLELTWRAKQEAQPGTALPASFLLAAEIAALGYTTREDLDGADAAELERAGLTLTQANDVISAFEAL